MTALTSASGSAATMSRVTVSPFWASAGSGLDEAMVTEVTAFATSARSPWIRNSLKDEIPG